LFSSDSAKTQTRKNFFVLSLLLLLAVQTAFAKATTSSLRAHVEYLCSNALEGRLTGTEGERMATQYVANYFNQLGLEPAGDNHTFFQIFDFTSVLAGKGKAKLRGRNVLAKLSLGKTSSPIILVGAHVDHLGHGQFSGSRAHAAEVGHIHAGADDNASGVASILEVATKLVALQKAGKLQGNKDIVFVAWSGEEYGTIGSTYFVKELMRSPVDSPLAKKIAAVINLDMVGHLDKQLIIQAVGSSSQWPELIAQACRQQAMPFVMQSDPYLPTDSTSFYVQGVPTLNFFTGAHDAYHTPRDKPENLNYPGIAKISELLVALLQKIEERQLVLTYTSVKKGSDRASHRRKIYLGTIPDYASADIKGVKISGVAPNSPAASAGLKNGDIIVRLAGKEVRDIYDYTDAFKELRVGDMSEIVVKRGQGNVTLNISPENRSQPRP